MSVATWKAFERRVCRLFGGERRGPAGQECSDCVGIDWACFEVKRSKRAVPEGRWILQARAHGKREGLPWVLVVGGHHDRSPVVVMDLLEFRAICEKAELVKPLLSAVSE